MIVEFCGTKWKIKEVLAKTILKKQGEFCDGYVDFDTQTIYLNKEMHPHRKAVALVHELMHVAYDRAGLPEKHEERTIRGLEHSLYELIHVYPEFYRNIKS